MLNQLIYTRCHPYRTLSSYSLVNRSDGFGVFSASEDMVSSGFIRNVDLVSRRVSEKNGSDSADNMYDSYDFFADDNGVLWLSFEHPRYRNERETQGGSKRSGVFIKQCLAGSIQGYPFEWFGCSAWDAYLRPDEDYYLNVSGSSFAELPEPLSKVPETPNGGSVGLPEIKAFVNDGRGGLLSICVWYLITQYGKSENERQALYIKDSSDNVAMWTAAIECAFSVELAKTIPFSTNKSKLDVKGAGAFYSYLVDEKGAITGNKRPVFMIIGFDPRDKYCSSYTVSSSGRAVFDAVSGKFSFPTDEAINSDYYRAVASFDDDLLEFASSFLPGLNVRRISPELTELFDAFVYFSDRKNGKRSYRETVEKLRCLVSKGMLNSVRLTSSVFDTLIFSYGSDFIHDVDSSLELTGIMISMAQVLGREDELISAVMDRASVMFSDMAHYQQQIASFGAYCCGDPVLHLSKTIFPELFNDTELAFYSSQFPGVSKETCRSVSGMFLASLTFSGTSGESVLNNTDEFGFICSAVFRFADDRQLLESFLSHPYLKKNSGLVNSILIAVGAEMRNISHSAAYSWWENVFNVCGGNIVSICSAFLRTKDVTVGVIEQLLSSRISSEGSCSEAVLNAFRITLEALRPEDNSGELFFGTWMSVSDLSGYGRIIYSARRCGLSIKAENRVFSMIDSSISCDALRSRRFAVLNDLREWAERLGRISVAVSYRDFLNDVLRSKNIESLIFVTERFSGSRFPLKRDYPASSFLTDICSAVSAFSKCGRANEIHLLMLGVFSYAGCDEALITAYCRSYITGVIKSSRNSRLPETLCSLTSAVISQGEIKGVISSDVRTIRNIADKVCQKVFPRFASRSLVQKVEKSKGFDDDIKRRTVSYLTRSDI